VFGNEGIKNDVPPFQTEIGPVVQEKVDVIKPFLQVMAVFVQDRPESLRDVVFERIREAVQIMIGPDRHIFASRVERGQVEKRSAAAAEGEDAEPIEKEEAKPAPRSA
jgi:hypothetical protein